MKVVTYTLQRLFREDDQAEEMVAQTISFSEGQRSKAMKKIFLPLTFCLTPVCF